MEPVDYSSQTTAQLEQALIDDIEEFMPKTQPAVGDVIALLQESLAQGLTAEEVASKLAEAGMLAEGVYQPPQPDQAPPADEAQGEEEGGSGAAKPPPAKSRKDRFMEAATRAMGPMGPMGQ